MSLNINNIQLRLRNFSLLTGYPIQNLKYLRKIGPPPQVTDIPVRGSEVFVHRLPSDALEDELFRFFRRAGEIYEIRLMVRPSGLANRGYAFVRYCNPQQAQNAIATLSKEYFRAHHKIFMEKSVENNRLFLSGIPLDKLKTEIWNELLRVGVRHIVDVIMHKSYKRDLVNRGFVFIEFETHEDAATTKREFAGIIRLWNRPVVLDWAEPIHDVDPTVMCQVTRIFVRNLDIDMKKETFIETLDEVLDFDTIQKVYKRMDYSFIHFHTREMAECGLKKLQDYYRNTDVEVTWSKPPKILTNRNLPPRLQKRKKKHQVESAWSTNSEISMQLENIQHQQTSREERDNNNREYSSRKYEKTQEHKKKLWMDETVNSNYINRFSNNDTNQNIWGLWREDFNWFDCNVKEKNTQKCDTPTESRYVHGKFNEKDHNKMYSHGTKDSEIRDGINCHFAYQDPAADGKKYSDLMQGTGISLFCDSENQSLNLALHLDLYEKRGNKYNAS